MNALEETVTGSTDAAASFTLTSWTPAANELILLAVMARDESITVTASGNGLTFVEVVDVDNIQEQGGLTVFRAMKSSGVTTGQITVTMTGNTKPALGIASRFSGVDTSGTDGSGAVEAFASNVGPDIDNDDVMIDVTTLTNNAWAWAAAWYRTKDLSDPPATGQTSIQIDVTAGSGGDTTRGATWYVEQATAGSVTLGEAANLSGDHDWAAVAVSIKTAAAAAARRIFITHM